MTEIQSCFADWHARLLQAEYTPDKFLLWLLKEYPAHTINIDAFHISKFPITNAQYKLFCDETKTAYPESLILRLPDDHPVWGVNFAQAQNYTQWLSRKEGVEFRLPLESEWEFAARGTERRQYSYGDLFSANKANTHEANFKTTTPVQKFSAYASEFGVCDLAGNVEEWVCTNYHPYPGGIWIPDDLTQTLGKDYPILRGGSFARGGDLSRAARRHGQYPAKPFRFTGFRIVSPVCERKEAVWNPKL